LEPLLLLSGYFGNKCFDGLNDDFNTAIAVASLFGMSKKINAIYNGQLSINALKPETVNNLLQTFQTVTTDILGLEQEMDIDAKKTLKILLELYTQAKESKDYAKVDWIRGQLKTQGIVIKDMKTKVDWAYEE